MDVGASSWQRYIDGEEAAFEEIVNTYRLSLTNFIMGYTHDYQIAEDIAIDVFAYVAAERKYDFKVSFKTYLFMIGRSRAIDYLRRKKRRASVNIEAFGECFEEIVSFEDEPEGEERAFAVRKAVAALPQKMRTVIVLVYFENMSYEETAKVMRLNKKQVDNLLYRAKAELRAAIGKEIF